MESGVQDAELGGVALEGEPKTRFNVGNNKKRHVPRACALSRPHTNAIVASH